MAGDNQIAFGKVSRSVLRFLLAGLGGLVVGAVAGAALLRPRPVADPVPSPAQAELDELRREWQRRRHDVRGALSPALLMADRMTSHADDQVRRSGEIVVQSLQRAIDALADPPC